MSAHFELLSKCSGTHAIMGRTYPCPSCAAPPAVCFLSYDTSHELCPVCANHSVYLNCNMGACRASRIVRVESHTSMDKIEGPDVPYLPLDDSCAECGFPLKPIYVECQKCGTPIRDHERFDDMI